VVSRCLPPGFFLETPYLDLCVDELHRSSFGSLSLQVGTRIAYTGVDSVVHQDHHKLCVQQGDHVKVPWWAVEQQRLLEALATHFPPHILYA